MRLLLLYITLIFTGLLALTALTFGAETSATIAFSETPVLDVLSSFSSSYGYIVVLETPVTGNLSCAPKEMTSSEARLWLNAQLLPLGYTAIVSGRMLTVISAKEAWLHDVPVQVGNEPALVPKTAEFVTQIIPVKYVAAPQLRADLSAFTPPQAKVEANTDGNTLVISDTQANVHHFLELVRAVDDSAAAGNVVWVMHLKHANPTELAATVSSVFGGNGQDESVPVSVTGDPSLDAAGSTPERLQKTRAVVAVADARTESIVVLAPDYLMSSVATLINSLDVASDRDQAVYTYHLNNADPEQVLQVLQGVFSSGSSSTSQSALMQRAQTMANTSTTASTLLDSGTTSTSPAGR